MKPNDHCQRLTLWSCLLKSYLRKKRKETPAYCGAEGRLIEPRSTRI